MAEFDQLTERMLRKDPVKAAAREKARKAAEIKHFLESRAAQAAAGGGGFNAGIADILTFMPGVAAAKAAKAGLGGQAAVNALAFTSQFDDSKLGQNVGDVMAAVPVIGGLSSIKGAHRSALRAAQKGKDLPMFSFDGTMSPQRQKSFEKQMDAILANSPKLQATWAETRRNIPGWGKRPIEKEILLDQMPGVLAQRFHTAAKQQGYGGIAMGERSGKLQYSTGGKLSAKTNEFLAELKAMKEAGVPDLVKTPNKSAHGGRVGAGSRRKFEEIYPGTTTPEGIERLNAKPETLWMARPGEKLPPGSRNILDDPRYQKAGAEWTAGLLGGSALGAVSNAMGPERGGGDQKAGLVVNRRNLGRLAEMQKAQASRLDKVRPQTPELNEIEAVFAAKYPKIYEKAIKGQDHFDTDIGNGGGVFDVGTGRVGVRVPKSNSEGWMRPGMIPEVMESLAHESVHKTDLGRLGKINDPTTGRRLDLGDFVTPSQAKDRRIMEGLRARASKERIPFPEKLEGNYITPRAANEMTYDLDTARGLYENQPIEKRAFKGGRTGRSSSQKLMMALDDPDFLPVDPPPKYYPPKPKIESPEEKRRKNLERLEELGGFASGRRTNLSDRRYLDILSGR